MSFLKFEDKVGIIAPSCNLSGHDLIPFISLLKSWNLDVVLADNLNDSYRYMAGDDNLRAAALNKMLQDDNIKALFCIRGGAGATRILGQIDFDALKRNPKFIIGLSDSTALQNAAFSLANNRSLTGFLPLYETTEGQVDTFLANDLRHALFDDYRIITSGQTLISGETQGELIGGCLSVFTQLCGTSYFPSLKDKILLLEDVGEKTYKIDLMLTQLKNQPDFNELKGIIFGTFSNCEIKDETDGTIDDCINDFINGINIPVIKDFAYGHIPQRYILPLGHKITLRAQENCTLEFNC